jgi:hypothetical protein
MLRANEITLHFILNWAAVRRDISLVGPHTSTHVYILYLILTKSSFTLQLMGG